MNKQWKTTFYTSKELIPHTIYGETHKILIEEAITFLCDLRPDYIGSGYNVYRKEEDRWIQGIFTDIDTKAYISFCQKCLNIQKGPEYIDHGFVDGKFRIEYVRQTGKYHDVDTVNRMLTRGWHILELEKDEQSGDVWYVLGHVEEDAS